MGERRVREFGAGEVLGEGKNGENGYQKGTGRRNRKVGRES